METDKQAYEAARARLEAAYAKVGLKHDRPTLTERLDNPALAEAALQELTSRPLYRTPDAVVEAVLRYLQNDRLGGLAAEVLKGWGPAFADRFPEVVARWRFGVLGLLLASRMRPVPTPLHASSPGEPTWLDKVSVEWGGVTCTLRFRSDGLTRLSVQTTDRTLAGQTLPIEVYVGAERHHAVSLVLEDVGLSALYATTDVYGLPFDQLDQIRLVFPPLPDQAE